MSNTLNTPVEALETEFPLRVRELSLRRGSGGGGRHRGGDGIVREIEALAPMRYTLIGERRRHPPRGREGGEDGETARDLLNGEPLAGKSEGESEARRRAQERDSGRRRPRLRKSIWRIGRPRLECLALGGGPPGQCPKAPVPASHRIIDLLR